MNWKPARCSEALTTTPPPRMLSHMGIYVRDVSRMVEFCTTLFKLRITDRGFGRRFNNELVFLSAHPEHHHQFVLASGCPADNPQSTVMQLSLKVSTIEELRHCQATAPEVGAINSFTLNHGAALSLYFADPEGNTIEVYFDTPYYVAQPSGDRLELNKTDAEIMGETLTTSSSDSTFMLAEDWRRRFAEAQAADASTASR
jgi:catechol 2,3-dioxygenase